MRSMTTENAPVFVIPRARLADWLRAIASLATGVITLLFAGSNSLALVPLGVVLIAYAIFLGIKLADKRPALIATDQALTIFRFPGQSHVVPWEWLDEVSYLKMRVKRVLFFKISKPDAGQVVTTTFEMPSTDFHAKGADIVEKLMEMRDRYA